MSRTGRVGGAEFGGCFFPYAHVQRQLVQGKAGWWGRGVCTAIRGCCTPTSQLQLRAHTGGHPRNQKKRQETGDHKGFQPRNGRAWFPPAVPSDPTSHSQLPAQEEEALGSEGLEKRLRECEQTHCQVSAGAVLASPRLPEPGLLLQGKRPLVTQHLNALQLSPVLILCCCRENKTQK